MTGILVFIVAPLGADLLCSPESCFFGNKAVEKADFIINRWLLQCAIVFYSLFYYRILYTSCQLFHKSPLIIQMMKPLVVYVP